MTLEWCQVAHPVLEPLQVYAQVAENQSKRWWRSVAGWAVVARRLRERFGRDCVVSARLPLYSLTAAAAIAVLAGGCAISKIGEVAAPAKIYDLIAPAASRHGPSLPLQLVVSEPSAVRALAGETIMVKTAAQSVAYFGDAQWSDQLPRLLESRLIQAIESSGTFQAVGDGRERMQADLELMTEIGAFQVEIADKRAVGVAALSERLVDARSGRVLATKQFEASAEASNDLAPSGVAALNQTLQSLLPAIATWASRTAAARAAELTGSSRANAPASQSTVTNGPG
jgi:cholesterol transport system auxiliary component